MREQIKNVDVTQIKSENEGFLDGFTSTKNVRPSKVFFLVQAPKIVHDESSGGGLCVHKPSRVKAQYAIIMAFYLGAV